MKMKSRSHRYYINRPRSNHEYKHSKYKKCFTMMMYYGTPITPTCITEHLSNI